MISHTQSLAMHEALAHSLLDSVDARYVSKPLPRIEGALKVSGAATYAAEYPMDALYGWLVGSTIASGKVSHIDKSSALAIPSVVEVVIDFEQFILHPQQGDRTTAPQQGAETILYFGQPLALVVAETLEAAREGASALKIAYTATQGDYDFQQALPKRESMQTGLLDQPQEQHHPDAALANAAIKVDVVYTTPNQNPAPMELHSSIAQWQGEQVIIHTSMQQLQTCRQQIADALQLKAENIRLIAPYVGGGFGSKLAVTPELIAAILAAKQLQRPVKVVMTRPHVFDMTVRRSNTQQRIALGADANGKLHTIIHNTIASNLPDEDFFEPAALATHFLYSGENRQVKYDLVRLNWPLAGSMRAPGEGAGLLALECAMDELAEQLNLDPVELRRLNDPTQDPSQARPFSTRHLTIALDEGAQRFGWQQRSIKPGSQLDGDWFIGMGMAAAARSNLLRPSTARITLTRDNKALVETDMTDIGTGTYTILAQITADLLGLTLSDVEVKLGDTHLPAGAGSGGSFGASSAGSSVYLACQKLREMLAQRLDIDPITLKLADGHASGTGVYSVMRAVVNEGLQAVGNLFRKNLSLPEGETVADDIESDTRSAPIRQLLDEDWVAYGKIDEGKAYKDYTQSGFGAHFAEVAVHRYTGEVRIKRLLGVYAAGRILNELTAKSQCYGGMVFGIGAALGENLVVDPRNGLVVNHDLGEYYIPVNADIPNMEVVFIPEQDHLANPLFSKGIGELGASSGAAIANAIYNATGIRIRDYPITLDKLIAQLPQA
jgi:xanthine dehydrogenase YagR molybdenum-binding subunit